MSASMPSNVVRGPLILRDLAGTQPVLLLSQIFPTYFQQLPCWRNQATPFVYLAATLRAGPATPERLTPGFRLPHLRHRRTASGAIHRLQIDAPGILSNRANRHQQNAEEDDRGHDNENCIYHAVGNHRVYQNV